MRTELHCHSNHSDGLASVEQILRKCSQLGLGAVAITDHNTFSGYNAAKKISKRIAPGVLLIPGIEITCSGGRKSGHLLALGVEDMKFRAGENVLAVIDRVRAEGGVSIDAHPFGGMMRNSFTEKDIVRKFDAVEVLNGNTFSWQNEMAMELADALNKPKTSGSDAHTLNSLGKMACDIAAENVPGILSAARKGKVKLPAANTSFAGVLGTRIKRKAANYASGRFRR